MSVRQESFLFRNGECSDPFVGKSGHPAAQKIDQIGVGPDHDRIQANRRSTCGPQTLHCHERIHDMKMGLDGLIQQQNVFRQSVMRFFLVLLTHKATHQVFQADAHADFEMGFQFGQVDEDVRLETFFGHSCLDAVFQIDDDRPGPVEVYHANPIVPCQPVHLQTGNDADAVPIKTAVGPLPDRDFFVAPVLQKKDHRSKQPEIRRVPRQGVHVGIQIGLDQDFGRCRRGQEVLKILQCPENLFPDFACAFCL